MKIVTTRTIAALLGLVLLVPATIPVRALATGAIMTGSPGSTSVRLGQDVADLARHFDIALEVVPSQGGLENIEALIRRPNTQLGIVQSDVLDFIRSFSDDPELRRRAQLLRVVSPLYPEEVHVLARPGIATFGDLRGKRVAVGAPGSGTLLTATLLLATAGIKPAEELWIDGEEALAALRGGRIDAMIYVAGQPAPLFKEGVAIEDALHLVPVDHPALRNLYPLAAIPADTYYPWQPEEVPTVAPQAVLMTLPWTGPGYPEEACRFVGKIARIIADNLDRLRRDGHPKWREVALDARMPGWARSPCVEQALGRSERYILDAATELHPPGRSLSSLEAGTAPQARPARRSWASVRACSAEADPIRRRLCEVRRQLGTRP